MTNELLAVSIGIGLAVGFLFTEFFGISSGGLVVPGYIALYIDQPMQIVVTFIVAFGAYFVVRIMSIFMIVYGRRRTALMILIGYLISMIVKENAGEFWNAGDAISAIGFIIPGLIATWMDRQGIIQTISSTLTISIIVRLILVAIGMEVSL